RRLAGAVGADERDAFARADGERQPVHRDDRVRLRRHGVAEASRDARTAGPPDAKRLRELLKFDGGTVGHGDAPSVRQSGVPEKQKRPSGNSGRALIVDECSSGLCEMTDTDVQIAMNGELAHRRRFAESRSKHETPNHYEPG